MSEMKASDRGCITRRIYATGVWTSTAALHVGGEESEKNVDMALLRSHDGVFFIPGTSIAGAARNHLAWLSAKTEAAYGERNEGKCNETASLGSLFGGEYASLLTIYDAPALAHGPVAVRDNVRLDPKTGIAADTAKFSREVLPAGSSFVFTFGLALPADMPGDGVEEKQVLGAFRAMLDGFSSGGIRLGARTRRGMGEGALTGWKIVSLSMNKREHVFFWLRQDWRRMLDPAFVAPAGSELELSDQTSHAPPDHSATLEIEAELRLKTSLLIRAASANPLDPDMVHLNENGRALLSGTSLAGALQCRCLRIARSLMPVASADAMNARLFGTHESNVGPAAGRVWTSEAELHDGSPWVHSRVAIDRFTSAALEAHLFEQAAWWPKSEAASHVKVHIRLHLVRSEGQSAEERLENEQSCAMILQAFKDLWLGDCTLGGEWSAGRGVFHGVSATIRRTGFPNPLRLSVAPGNGPADSTIQGWDEHWAGVFARAVPAQPLQQEVSL